MWRPSEQEMATFLWIPAICYSRVERENVRLEAGVPIVEGMCEGGSTSWWLVG
jgi:hypothetical protein